MTIDRDVKIEINLSELVNIRSVFLQEEMTEGEIEDLANELRLTLTFDTLFGMVDDAILEYLDKADTHYGDIQPKPKEFEMVDLVSSSWTIQVPRRIKK